MKKYGICQFRRRQVVERRVWRYQRGYQKSLMKRQTKKTKGQTMFYKTIHKQLKMWTPQIQEYGNISNNHYAL